MNIPFKKTELQQIDMPAWTEMGVEVSVLREDLVHPFVSGNKWRKLKYNIAEFKKSGKKKLVTFGGAFSNHLVATALATKMNEIDSIGIVRGESLENLRIQFMHKNGMKLHFISRNDYRQKENPFILDHIIEELVRKNLIEDVDEIFLVPEGGSNESGVRGTEEIMDEIPDDTQFIACACGTGATLAGISRRLKRHQQAIGIPVLNAQDYIENQVRNFNGNLNQVIIKSEYHFGGYAKTDKRLLDFCEDFIQKTQIPVEPVYTGKLFYAIDDMIRNGFFQKGKKISIIHTGGLFPSLDSPLNQSRSEKKFQ